MSKPLVSIVVPAYNAGRTLSRCIDSIIAQTCPDWELICVDDGSRDDTASVLDARAAGDSRIKAVHKANGGVSQARNDALKLACGEFVLFVDSDDFIHPQTVEICTYLARRENADLVAFTYSRHFHTLQVLRHILHLRESRSAKFPQYVKEALNGLVTENILRWSTEYSKVKDDRDPRWLVKHCQPWRCLYRTERIRSIEFIPGIIYEDFPWWSRVMLNVRRAVIINLPLYYYYPNFSGYIHSAGDGYKVESLRKAIATIEREMKENATEEQYAHWEANFLTPFKRKLHKKQKGLR